MGAKRVNVVGRAWNNNGCDFWPSRQSGDSPLAQRGKWRFVWADEAKREAGGSVTDERRSAGE